MARLFRYTVVAYAASAIMPLRAGELVRLWLLKKRDGVPIADASAAVVAQKLIDGVTMIIFVAPIPFLLDVPTWVGRTILTGSAIVIVLFVVLYLALGYLEGRATRSWMTRFLAGMHVMRSPRRLALVMGAQFAAWLIDLAMVAFVLYAVGIDLPIAAGLLILFTLNLSIIVPVPANLGSLEVGVFAATRLLGVDHEPALASARLYHASLVVPILVASFAPRASGHARARARRRWRSVAGGLARGSDRNWAGGTGCFGIIGEARCRWDSVCPAARSGVDVGRDDARLLQSACTAACWTIASDTSRTGR